MTRKCHALIAFTLLLAVSIADLWITLHYNPTLSSEANPLVAKLGMKQFGLIASNLLIVASLGFAMLFYQKGSRSIPFIPVSDPWEYVGVTLYNKRMTKVELWRAFLLCWPLPSNWHQFFRFAGFLTVWTIVAARTSAVFAWIVIYGLNWASYDHFRELIVIAGYPCLELLIGLIVGAIMFRVLVLSEYQIDKHQQNAAEQGAAPGRRGW